VGKGPARADQGRRLALGGEGDEPSAAEAGGAAAGPPFPPALALVSGVLAVSTGAIFARLAEAPALVTAAYRVGLATLLWLPLGGPRLLPELRRLPRRDIALALLAGVFLAAHFGTWISSLDYTSVATSVVLVNTNPLWVALLTPLVTRERISRLAAASIGISVAGGVVIGAGDLALGGPALWGDALALAGSLCAAAYLLLGRRVRRGVSLGTYVLLCYGAAAAVLWLLVGMAALPVTGFSRQTWLAFAGMAVVSQLVGHTSYNWALKWLPTSYVAVGLLGEPVGATLLAYLLFDETLTAAKWAGGLMILAGIYLAARAEGRR
jgi:drug/metabolite transporter (DMT)-like permease